MKIICRCPDERSISVITRRGKRRRKRLPDTQINYRMRNEEILITQNEVIITRTAAPPLSRISLGRKLLREERQVTK